MDFTWDQAKAVGKHVASYAAGGVTFAVGLHFLSPSQGADISADVDKITTGLQSVAEGVAGIIGVLTPIYTAWRAQRNQKPAQMAAALEKQGALVIGSPELAAATPNSPGVVSRDTVTVTTK